MVTKGDVLAYVGKAGEPVPVERTAASSPAARVAPMVRNLAKKLGVELAGVQGTGRGGVLTREDILNASRTGATESASAAGEPLLRSQAAVARAVLKSIREIPHLRLSASIDMSMVEKIRADSAAQGAKVSYDAVFLKALAKALEAVPLVAAKLEGDRIIQPKGLHVAVAIGRGDELLLPVVRDVNKKDLSTVQREIANLAERSDKGDLKPEELTGGCMTLSNLGMYAVESFDAIIFPEHSAILAVGAVQEKPVAAQGRVEIRPLAAVTLAVDHRLINGRTAAEFLARLKALLESGEFN